MLISVHSNVVSGLYVVVFEALLPLILCVALQTYIYAHNLHVIHNRKACIRLTTTRLSRVASFGITSKRNARLTSFLGVVSLILTIIGSFSIDGTSRIITKEVNIPLFVSVANSSGDAIDFSKHVTEDGSRMSATLFFAVKATACYRRNETHILTYPAFGDFDNFDSINSVIYTNRSLNFNLSCALEQEKAVRVQEYIERIEDYDLSNKRCSFNSSLTERNSSLWKEDFSFDCDAFEVIETWCASFQFFTCVSQFRTGMKHSYVYLTPKRVGTQSEQQWTIVAHSSSNAIPSRALKSAAYLMATGVDNAEVIYASRMSLKRNVAVEMEDGRVLETEVSVPLFLGTAGVVTASTMMVCMVTLLKWRQQVVKHGLRGKNGYNGAMDVIVLAAQLGADEKEVASNDEVVVGVSGGEPRVGPMAESRIGGSGFDEHGVEGRLRGRTNEIVLHVARVGAQCNA